MLRKSIKNSGMLIAALAMIFVLNSCDQNSGIVSPALTTNSSDYNSYSYFAEVPSLSADGIGTEASIDNPLVISSDMPYAVGVGDTTAPCGGIGKGHGKGHDGGKGGPGDSTKICKGGTGMPKGPFGKIFADLGLDSLQKIAIQTAITAHRTCEKTAFEALRAAQLPIIEAGNAERKLILDDLKNAVITRAEAKTKLQELNTNIRTQMENDPAVQAALAQMKACFDTLLADIRALLTPDQQIKWDAFVATLPVKK